MNRWLPACILLVCSGCDSALAPEPDPDPDPRPLPTACEDPGGTTHAGVLQGAVVWRGADGPHRLGGTVWVRDLTIEPGTLVCGSAGAAIEIELGGTLTASGTADAPITFTAADPARPWGGILHAGNELFLSHAIVEHATHGVVMNPQALAGTPGAEIRHSSFRVLQGPALHVGYWSTALLVESTLDSACLGDAGVASCAAVNVVGRRPWLRFEESVIRNSGGIGIQASTVGSGPAYDLTLVGGAIENSADVGLVTSGHTQGFDVIKPIRITGGHSYPARVHPALAVAQLATPEGHDAWRGNAPDPVDARDNWWGDPAGPNGPAGDGVEGNVLFEPWRTEPARPPEAGPSAEPGA